MACISPLVLLKMVTDSFFLSQENSVALGFGSGFFVCCLGFFFLFVWLVSWLLFFLFVFPGFDSFSY